MPEVENLTAADKPCRSIPDPFGPVAHNHHGGVGSHPAQLPELPVEPMEDRVGVPEAADQKPPYQRMAPRRDLDAFLRQQQNAGLNLTEMAVGNGGERRQFLPFL